MFENTLPLKTTFFLFMLIALVSCSSKQKQATGFAEVTVFDASTKQGVQTEKWQGARAPAGGEGVPYVKPKAHNSDSTPAVSPKNPETQQGEAMARCSMDLSTIPIGGPHTVWSMLVKTNDKGNFAGGWANDQAYLKPWFSSYQGAGSELFESVKDTPAYNRALQYVFGNHSGSDGGKAYTYQDYWVGPKMAAVLVAMMATARDPECTKWIRAFAARMLKPALLQELDAIPFVKAAESVRDGRIREDFNKIDENKEKIQSDIQAAEDALAAKELQHESAMTELKSGLSEAYQELRKEMAKIPACSQTTYMQVLLVGSETTEKSHIEGLVSNCKASLEKKLTEFREKEIKLIAQSSKMLEARLAKDGIDNDRETEPSEKEELLNKQLADLQKKTQRTQDYLAMLSSPERESVATHAAKINNLLVDKKKLVSPDFFKVEKQKIESTRLLEKNINPSWVTYGLFGGFAPVNSL